MNSKGSRYLLELFSVIGIYTIVLFVSVILLKANPTHPLRIAIALAPMLPALFLPVVVLRALRQMDELQRRIQLESLGIAFAGTAVITFSYGFLENVGFPRVSSFVVWPIMAVLWVMGLWIANRRYR